MKAGEIVEASTREFLAECYDLYCAPPFGSLVRTSGEGIDIFAVVQNTVTSSREPGRTTVALGKKESTEDEIYNTHPQLSRLLRTCFKALVVGYREGPSIRQFLPSHTPHIHGFVFRCDKAEIQEFSQSLDFLSLLAASETDSSPEELIGASLRYMSLAREKPQEFLVAAGKELTLLFNRDFNKLTYILRRIKV